MQPGDEAMMKIHKILFIGIPLNFKCSVISPKLQEMEDGILICSKKNTLLPVEPREMKM